MEIRSGVDLIEIERVARMYRRRPGQFLRRFFSPAEQAELNLRKFRARHLAARIAAKEAVFKLLGAGLGQVNWTDVEILSRPGGEPWVRLNGRAEEQAAGLCIRNVSVSLSHNRQSAVAHAVALAGEN